MWPSLLISLNLSLPYGNRSDSSTFVELQVSNEAVMWTAVEFSACKRSAPAQAECSLYPGAVQINGKHQLL